MSEHLALNATRAPDAKAPIAEHALVRTVEAVSTGTGTMPCGTVGTIVFVHEKDDAFEVEFEPPFAAVASVYRRQIEAI